MPEQKADIIFHVFINKHVPIHMYPYFILSDNGTEFKNQLMDNVLTLIASFLLCITHKVMEN